MKDAPEGHKHYFSYVLSKDQCSFDDGNQEIKNLSFFCGEGSGRDIKDCIIIDNNIYNFQKHLTNGLIIPKYEGTQDDHWLKLMQDYLLERLCGEEDVEDVRVVIGQDFSFRTIIDNTRTSKIKAMMNKHVTVGHLSR